MRQKGIGLLGRLLACCLPNLTSDSWSSNCRQCHAVVIFLMTIAASLRLDYYQSTSP